MTAVYTQPAAANYYTPASAPHQKARGYRLCDQCGAIENPVVARFRLCGGCMTTQYCVRPPRVALSYRTATDARHQSGDCQKAHWSAHKAICQHTASQIAATQQPGAGYPDDGLAKHLRKFTSAHQNLLNWAGFQALQLKRVPANVRSQALLVELDYRNSSSSDSLRR